MLLLVGLGNPEAKYAGNRHNIGFMVADAIADAYGFSPARSKFQGAVREGVLEGHGARGKALILKPGTYYNESGRAVRAAADFYKIAAEDIVVFHDELDLAPGKLKVKSGGGTAGNNGLKSIAAHLGGDFRRARIGIGHPGSKDKVTPWVLGDFSRAERADWVDEMIAAMTDAAPLLAAPADADAKFMSRVAYRMNPAPAAAETKARAITPKTANASGQAAGETEKTVTTDKTSEPVSPFDKLKGLLGGTKND